MTHPPIHFPFLKEPLIERKKCQSQRGRRSTDRKTIGQNYKIILEGGPLIEISCCIFNGTFAD